MNNQSSHTWQKGRGELDRLTLTTANGASAEIYRHGAHLTSWRTAAGREWIFTSKQAEFATGKPIRGGVPIIFPQFNAFGSGPRHGFARTQPWQLTQAPTERRNHCVLSLYDNPETKTVWDYEFETHFHTDVGDNHLRMTLNVKNCGDKPFQFTAALHTYFAVTNFGEARLRGLNGLSYWDNDGSDFQQRQNAQDDELAFNGPIDRVYFNATTPLTLIDADQQLDIASEGFKEVVVWNPGAAAARKLADLDNDEWHIMLCIEAANIDKPVVLAPGEGWHGSQILTA